MSPYTTQPAISAYTGVAQKQQARMTTAQPPIAMSSMQPTADALHASEEQRKEEEALRLRGGGFNDVCPGRFCFIIPCPIPCNFCVFPIPCC
ncbi:hypothetical protein FFLO_04064 [Filobasidium floriforme]|uniref:Uncharacterized protein n=1 Tax=Filobasidium floriforme TaxID=5210 RepID=A0A8K0JJK8_9TREE|nr:uncharacterized protein HD553DRAFT_343421 [Filobasidium floriforme]KAG7531838.1 hypothetical protein FFLO_04064 [Filobasidium floriforme]KAH8082657.1 hypothetical protein HD553DRAFT_343421 [Filobasidium floriforme]